MIRYILHNEIDKVKWDDCIKSSKNSLVYAMSWYLDLMCKGWEALVDGDYETVMPVTRGMKYGISYFYQPVFLQQLGVFSSKPIDQSVVNNFIKEIPSKYKFIDIALNSSNLFEIKGFEIEKYRNYELDLAASYDNIYSKYSRSAKNNLKKALRFNLSVTDKVSVYELMSVKQKNDKAKVKKKHYLRLKKIIEYATENNLGEILGIKDQEELLAAAFMLHSRKRYIYLMSGSTNEGREKRAMFLLLDSYIKKRAGQQAIFDFEGSNIPGIASFFDDFGAKPVFYPRIKRNTLPWYLRIFKK